MSGIDSIDEAIMAAFQADGRQSNREVARLLNVSEGTVRQRLRKLTEAHAIQFDVVTDATISGINFVAFVRIAVAPDRLETLLQACCAVPELWYVAATAGRFNAVCLVCAGSAQEALQVINRSIEVLPGISEVDVRQTVGQTRHDFREVVVPRTPPRDDSAG